ncbi:head maturation protease, ClpP-related [Paenibacillus daejeonensis]|uniref:head maturation protease, ClpP-related n=1 Tax=Paenibacillus daejeonensis TaxID=135193 RepID=UPI00037DFE13|nr:head maturation protease, ClpP-related [Paenibacillus daejeonensis]
MPTRIEVRGVIIPNDYQWVYDLFEWDATSPGKVGRALATANGDELEVIINSNGGDVFSGSEIYTMLKDYPANVVVKIVGVAASAASVAAMGGDTVMITPPGQLMIHNASTETRGDKRDHQHTAEMLKTVDAGIANAYRLKTGMSQQELTTLMNKETWMSAQDALKYKFADEVMFDPENQLSAVAAVTGDMIPLEVLEKIRTQFANFKTEGVGSKMPGEIQNQGGTQQATNQQQSQPQAQQPAQQPTQQQSQASNVSQPDVVAQERARLKAIDEIAVGIDPDLVNEAKYGDNPMSAEQLAFRAMKEGKMLNTGTFDAAIQANKAAGTDNVKAQTNEQQQGQDKEFDTDNLKDVNAMMRMFAGQSQATRQQQMGGQ